MRLLLVALGLALIAALAAPPARTDARANEVSWPLPARRLVALGRPSAAAKLAWLKTIQLIGSADYERRGFPTLETWLESITSLDPSFEHRNRILGDRKRVQCRHDVRAAQVLRL